MSFSKPRRASPRRRTCASVAMHLLGAVCLLLQGAVAQENATPGFAVQRWTLADGLPQGSVVDLLAADNGFVFVATLGGLCRFDGDRLDVFDPVRLPGMPSNRMSALCETAAGTIWFGTNDRGLGLWRDERHAEPALLDHGAVYSLATDAKGALFVGSSEGILRIVDGKMVTVDDRLRRAHVLLATSSGDVFAGTSGGLARLGDDAAHVICPDNVTALAEADGELLAAGVGWLAHLVGDKLERLDVGLPPARVRDLLVASDGALWLGTGRGLYRVSGDDLKRAVAGESVTAQSGFALPDEHIMCLCEGPEGGIWVGHERSGFSRLSPAELRPVAPDLLARDRVSTVVVDATGDLLFTTPGGAWRLHDGQRQKIDCEGVNPHFLLQDSAGQVWASTKGTTLSRLEGNRLVPYPFGKRAPRFGSLRAMVEFQDGRLWVLGRDAIVEMRGDEWQRVDAYDEHHTGAMTRVEVAPDGAVWTAGPVCITRLSADRQQLQVWHRGEELPVGDVRALMPEAGVNAWAASYGGGIIRIADGQVHTVDQRHGLVDQAVCAMTRVGDKFLVAANRGCCVLDEQAALAVVRGEAATLGCRQLRFEGQNGPECNGSRQLAIAQREDHVWICCAAGLYEFMPKWLEPPHRQLAPYVRALFVGDQRVAQACADGASASIEPGARTVTLHLGACAFEGNDRVRFRWRVPGLHDEWSVPSYDREIRIDNLPAGAVEIEAESIDLTGERSVQPLKVALAIPPYLWETTTFAVVAPLTAILLVWLLVRAFSAHSRRRAEQLQAVVEQRTSDLVDARDRLEERVAERTAELTESLARTEQEMESRQQLERELHDLRRAETIGKLAGGVAHDFNNLLTVTLGSAELLAGEIKDESPLELVRNIVMASTRGRSLTQHLLAVASRQVVTAGPLDLVQVVGDLMPVLTTLVGEDIELSLTAPDKLTVCAAVTQIEQILINLVANARDAIEGAGTVRIELCEEDGSAVLRVTDDGAGMSEEVQENAFEPFYTTKDQGDIGRGLGLATVYGIVKQIGGAARVDSELGRGTTMTVTLPITDEATVAAAQAEGQAPAQLSGRVLLIEDQVAVRDVLSRQLAQLGCEVTTAHGGDEAIALLADGLEVDVVVSDVVMPGMQGAALVEALRNIIEGLPIVFVSGYMDGRRAHSDISRLGFQVLAKPVDMMQLGDCLARYLSTPADEHK